MALWVIVLLAVIIAPLVFKNRSAAEKASLKSRLKILIGLWVIATLVQIIRVGYTTHWVNVPALMLVACIPFVIIVGVFMWMSKNALR